MRSQLWQQHAKTFTHLQKSKHVAFPNDALKITRCQRFARINNNNNNNDNNDNNNTLYITLLYQNSFLVTPPIQLNVGCQDKLRQTVHESVE